MPDRIATVEEVKRLSQQQQGDNPDLEVEAAIDDADAEIYADYGRPLDLSRIRVTNEFTIYEFREDKKETFRTDLVEIKNPDDGTRLTLTTPTDYTIDLEENIITITQAIADTHSGRNLLVHYVRKEFEILSKNKAALNFLDNIFALQNTDDNDQGNIRRIAMRIKRVEKMLQEDMGVEGSFENRDFDIRDGKFIVQRRFRTGLT